MFKTLEKLPFTEWQISVLEQGLRMLIEKGVYRYPQITDLRALLHRIENAQPDQIKRITPVGNQQNRFDDLRTQIKPEECM